MEKSPFALHFNFLKYVGVWPIETENPIKKKLYIAYSLFTAGVIFFVAYTGILDLYDSLDNFRKVSYNLCINFMMMGNWIKSMQNLHKSSRINNLRRILHRDLETCWDEEERQMCISCERELYEFARFFYIVLVVCFPVWILQSFFSYMWGDRYLPVPSRWPGVLGEPSSYNYVFAFLLIFSFLYMLTIMEMDFSMFSLVMEIDREYKFLIKRIHSYVDYFEKLDAGDVSKSEREVNVYLRKIKTKKIIRQFILRQIDLIRYTEEFEYGYNLTLLIQIFGGGFLIVINGVELLIVSLEFNIKMTYQIGYVTLILADFSYFCWLTDRVATKCIQVGTAVYELPWYNMDLETQRDILIMIIRAQKPPQITAGKVLDLNLPAFSVMMKNIYSWLALYRQFV